MKKMPPITNVRRGDELYCHDLTLGKLRQFLEKNKDLPDNTPILYQRIEDSYFNKPGNGWDCAKVPDLELPGDYADDFLQASSLWKQDGVICISAHY